MTPRWVRGSTIAALALVATLLAAAGARPAAACPCCGPCSKYDRMMQPPVIEVPMAPVYVRARPAVVGKRGDVLRVLTGARWLPRRAAAALPRLRLVALTAMPATTDPAAPEQTLIVRNVIARGGRLAVALGGALYQVSPCRDRGRATTCLVRLAEAPAVDDLVPEQGDFAAPPP